MIPATKLHRGPWARSALFSLITLLATGQSACIATTAKLRVGPVVDLDGKAALQSDLAFGFGLATSEDSALTGSLGVGSGTGNHLELTDTIEYHQLEEDYAWRSGVRADIGLVGDKAAGGWILGALLVPVQEHRSSSGGGKGGLSTRTTTRWSLGFEARLGLLAREIAPGVHEQNAAMGAAATLEWHALIHAH